MEKTELSFLIITERIKEIIFPPVDLVVGIGRGGVVPASLIAFHLDLPLEIIQLSYRNEENNPRFDTPQLVKMRDDFTIGNRILIVDDVSVSGRTLAAAGDLLKGSEITSFVLKGAADICAFPEINNCVDWPWRDSAKDQDSNGSKISHQNNRQA